MKQNILIVNTMKKNIIATLLTLNFISLFCMNTQVEPWMMQKSAHIQTNVDRWSNNPTSTPITPKKVKSNMPSIWDRIPYISNNSEEKHIATNQWVKNNNPLIEVPSLLRDHCHGTLSKGNQFNVLLPELESNLNEYISSEIFVNSVFKRIQK